MLAIFFVEGIGPPILTGLEEEVLQESAWETVNRILNGHRSGHYELQATVNLLETYALQAPDPVKEEIFHILWETLSSEPLKSNSARGSTIPNVHAVVIRSIAQFGPTAELPARVFGLLRWGNPLVMEFWARTICSQLWYSMSQNEHRFPQSTLNQTKALCALYTADRTFGITRTQFPSSVIDAAAKLQEVVEHIEYSRFAASLQPAPAPAEAQFSELDSLLNIVGFPDTVAAAMNKAESYLRGNEQFDPKNAADLVRTSVDEIHRAVVAEIEKMTCTECHDTKKDGARRAYMRERGFVSQPEEIFFSSIYTLLSEEGTHKLLAEKETVVFMTDTVRRYLLLLLRRLAAKKTALPSDNSS